MLLRSLRTSIDENTKAINENDSTATDSTEPPPSIIVRSEVSLPPTIHAYYESEQHERPSRNNWEIVKRGIEIIAFVSAIAAGVFTYKSLDQIQKQTPAVIQSGNAAKTAADTAHEALLASQRPWLGVDGFPIISAPLTREGEGLRTSIDVTVKNFGTAPAMYVAAYTQVVDTSEEPPPGQFFTGFKRVADSTCKMADVQTAPTVPGEEGSGRYIFPNNQSTWRFTSVTPIKTMKWTLDVVGCIAYRDQFTRDRKKWPPHHSRFCFMSQATIEKITTGQALTSCPINESID
jgi:hypothetical protein